MHGIKAALCAVVVVLAVAAPAAAQHVLRDATRTPITVASVQQLLESLSFTFESAPLTDGSPRMLGSRSTTLIELYGHEGDLVQAVLLGIASGDDQSVNLVLVAGIAGLIKAITPSNTDWVTQAISDATRRAERARDGRGVVNTSSAGIVVSLVVDRTRGSYVLIVQHPLNENRRGG